MSVGWKVEKLGALCEIKTGRKDVNEGNPTGAYPFFTCARTHTYSDVYSFDGEAILIAGNGDVGHTSYYNGKFEAYQRTYVLMGFQDVLPSYLFRVLDGMLKSALFDQKLGNTMPYIKKGMLTEFPIPLPSLPEQRCIVAILDEAFEGIDTAVANAEKNLASARELFDSYLRSVFARKGRGWSEKKLGDICENLDSRRIPITKSERSGGNIPYYGASGIVDYVSGHIFDEDVLLISEDGANLLARTYPIAFSVSGKSWVNNHAHVVRFSRPETQKIVELYLNSISLAPFISGMAQPKLNQKSLNSIPVFVPPIAEQVSIVEAAGALQASVERLEDIYREKLAALVELKRTVLHMAFAGELTAQPVEAVQEAAE